MKYTDQNIPINCSVCDALCEGLDDTIHHILEAHGEEYSQYEAQAFAERWLEGAYDVLDQEEAEYHKNQKLVNAIRRNAGEI